MSNDVTEILKGFQVPYDTLWQLKQYFEKRQKTKVSEYMSTEAKLAIQQIREEFLVKRGEVFFQLDHKDEHKKKDSRGKKSDKKIRGTKCDTGKRFSISEPCTKPISARKDSNVTEVGDAERMKQNRKLKKRKEDNSDINGEGKCPYDDKDDLAIAETAKLNSVQKCMVWMEVNEESVDTEKPPPHVLAKSMERL